MKKIILSILIITMIVSLFSCVAEEKDYTVINGNTKYTVDVSEKTISDGTNIYKYTFTENSENMNIEIIYPDGSSYFEMRQGNSTASGWSHGYDEEKYPSGEILCDVVVNERKPKSEMIEGLIIAAIFAVLGIIMIVFPGSRLWYRRYGWMFKNAEPSEAAITMNYVLGGICIAVAIGFAVNVIII